MKVITKVHDLMKVVVDLMKVETMEMKELNFDAQSGCIDYVSCLPILLVPL